MHPYVVMPLLVCVGAAVLAISYQIVQNHHGRIRAESAPGHGAIFRVELPTVGDRAAELAEVG